MVTWFIVSHRNQKGDIAITSELSDYQINYNCINDLKWLEVQNYLNNA